MGGGNASHYGEIMGNIPLIDYNPSKRSTLDFTAKLPSVLRIGIAKLNWILSIQTFVDGIDLSHWNWSENREPDFGIIKANKFDFVIFKATQGIWFKDEKFESGWMAALDNDLVTMIYHFFEGRSGGAEQARYCTEYAKDYLKAVNGKTIIFDDIERTYGEDMGQRQRRAHAFNQTIVEEGFETGNYSSPSLWKMLMGATPLSWVNDYWQWDAHWTPNLSPILPIGWTKEKCKFWQYAIWPKHSWAKKVGTNGNVDVVRFYGTIEDLKKLLGSSNIPNDCCEEIKKELADIHLRLAAIDDSGDGFQQRLAALNKNDFTISQLIDAIERSINVLRSDQANFTAVQNDMRKQLDEIQDLHARVRKAVLQ